MLLACSESKNIDGLDTAKWKADPGGCNGDRLEMLAFIKAGKEEFRESGSNEIDGWLGKPDAKDLDKRKRRYYKYYLMGSEECPSDSGKIYLQIRFNALDRADEIIIYE